MQTIPDGKVFKNSWSKRHKNRQILKWEIVDFFKKKFRLILGLKRLPVKKVTTLKPYIQVFPYRSNGVLSVRSHLYVLCNENDGPKVIWPQVDAANIFSLLFHLLLRAWTHLAALSCSCGIQNRAIHQSTLEWIFVEKQMTRVNQHNSHECNNECVEEWKFRFSYITYAQWVHTIPMLL